MNNFGRLAVIAALAAYGMLTSLSAGVTTVVFMVVGAIFLIVAKRPPQLSVTAVELARHESETARRVWPGNVATQAKLRLDQVLMILLTSPTQIGFYAVGVSVAQIFSLAIFGVRSYFFRSIASSQDGAEVALLVRIIGPMLVIFAIPALALARPMIVLLFGAEFEPATIMFQILVLGVIPQAIGGVLGVALNAGGKASLQSLGQWIGLSVSTATLVVAAPTLGGIGACLASAVGYLASGCWSAVWFKRTYKLSWRTIFVLNSADIRWLYRKFRKG